MQRVLNSCPEIEQARSPALLAAGMRARQNAKLAELKRALIESGYETVHEQARALGLCRSSTWVVLNAGHKCNGLSSRLIKRITASPELPPKARKILQEYIHEKIAGAYGHPRNSLKRFRAEFGAFTPAEPLPSSSEN